MTTSHVPVLRDVVLTQLAVCAGGRYVDGTAGGGGHSEAMLRRSEPDGRLLALDRDPAAVERVQQRVKAWGDRATVVQSNFSEIKACAKRFGFENADGVLLDLGMSSDQLSHAERGFSFQEDGPLDMRMNPNDEVCAADIVNEAGEVELRDMLRELGEERDAGRIAAAIAQDRQQKPFRTTEELAALVARVKGYRRRGQTHPATKTFQALRMQVNGELECLRQGLESAMQIVRPGGRVAVMTFHSLEDRKVKQMFRCHVGRWESLQQGGERWIGDMPKMKQVTRRPIKPTQDEVQLNRRARSAKLRVVERIS